MDKNVLARMIKSLKKEEIGWVLDRIKEFLEGGGLAGVPVVPKSPLPIIGGDGISRSTKEY